MKNRPPELFDLKKKNQIPDLKFWLQNRKYNTYIETTDKLGTPMIGLLWDYHLGQFPSPKRIKRGLILVRTIDCLQPALVSTLNAMSVENEFGKCWRKNQLDIVLYGREYKQGFRVGDQTHD